MQLRKCQHYVLSIHIHRVVSIGMEPASVLAFLTPEEVAEHRKTISFHAWREAQDGA